MPQAREKLPRILAAAAGLAVLAGLAAVFFLAVLPRAQAPAPDSITYSLEGLDQIPEDKILYREGDAIPLPAAELYAICLLPKGGLAVSGDSSIFLFDKKGVMSRMIRCGEPVLALAAADEALFCGMRGHVEVYGLDGVRRDEWAPLGEEALVFSIAAARGMIWAADAGNKNIACFDRGGRLLRFIDLKGPEGAACNPQTAAVGAECSPAGSGFLIPGLNFDLAAGPADSLWVVDPGRHRVLKLSPEGKILKAWGKASPALDGFVGCCNPGNIAVFPDGSFVTQEKGLLRIKLFDPDGRFTGFVAGPKSFHPSLAFLDLAAGPDGVVYAVDTRLKAVRRFIRKGGA